MRQILLDMLRILFLITFTFHLFAQENEKIRYQADIMIFGKIKNEKIRRLKGNVVFTQKNTVVYCDSAYFYVKKNTMEAMGNVKIIDNDTVNITGKTLNYDGNLRLAQMRNQVVYDDTHTTLFTDFLDYHLENKEATYFNGGQLKDSTNELKSKKAIFYTQLHYVEFLENVELYSPDFNLFSDTLTYNTTNKIAKTEGPTHVVMLKDSSIVDAIGGTYKTQVEQTELKEGIIETPKYIMSGDDLFFDELKKLYVATGNVKLISKDNQLIITGAKGYYSKSDSLSIIFGNPVMKKTLEQDTLFLRADTLKTLESTDKNRERILAYLNVKIFKSKMQGVCDSMAYFNKDSLLIMYDKPIIWNENNQSSGDTIILYIKNNTIDWMDVLQNSFIISQDTLGQYNQIKGRTMRAYFKEKQIDKVFVSGNGESLYHALNENDTQLIGLNRILCSNMTIRFLQNELQNISFYVQPEARFIPPHEITETDNILDGFKWQSPIRPELDDIFKDYTTTSIENSIESNNENPKSQPTLPDSGNKKKEKKSLNKNLLKDKNVIAPNQD